MLIAVALAAQALWGAEFSGTLRLLDGDQYTTPLENLPISIRSVERGVFFNTRLDSAGRFILTDMSPGHYTFELSFPARFVSVSLAGKPVQLPIFEVKAGQTGPLDIDVSVKTTTLSVDAANLPATGGPFSALLAPADPMLTLQHSCISNTLSSPHTEFRFLVPGRYRLFIIDHSSQTEVASYGPRFPDFLSAQAPLIDAVASESAKASANYIDAQIVRAAVTQHGPLVPQGR